MRYWIRPRNEADDAREVEVIDDDEVRVALGALEVDWVTGATVDGEVTASVAFVGMAVE